MRQNLANLVNIYDSGIRSVPQFNWGFFRGGGRCDSIDDGDIGKSMRNCGGWCFPEIDGGSGESERVVKSKGSREVSGRGFGRNVGGRRDEDGGGEGGRSHWRRR